jgi:hypothetical protein
VRSREAWAGAETCGKREEQYATMILVSMSDPFDAPRAEFAALVRGELAELQESPITDLALVKHAMTDAALWMVAVNMQHHRILEHLDDFIFAFPRRVDFQFLLVSLTRLRRAISFAAEVDQLKQAFSDRLVEFDGRVPFLSRLRNIGEHFYDYAAGRGRGTQVRRAQLRNSRWASGPEAYITWLGEKVHLAEVRAAAENLHSGFISDVNCYLREQEDLTDTS